MYQPKPATPWFERIRGSARTLAAVLITAVLALALTMHWNNAAATGISTFVPMNSAVVAGIPVSVEGSVVGASDGLVALLERGAESPVAFPVSDGASLMRDGQAVVVDDLRVGDTVRMTIDGQTGQVLRLHATPAASTFGPRVPGSVALLAAFGLIAGATALAILNLDRLPSVPARVPALKLSHAHGAR